MLRRHFLSLAALGYASLLHGRPALAAGDPRAFVEDLAKKVVGTLKSEEDVSARAAKLSGILRQGLDIEGMARFALGRHARSLDAAQIRNFDAAFEHNIVETYSDLLARQTLAEVEIGSAQKASDMDFLVESTVRQGGKPVIYGWKIRETDAGLKVFDVVVGGVSLLTSRRQEFGAVIQREGVDGLIKRLKQQAA